MINSQNVPPKQTIQQLDELSFDNKSFADIIIDLEKILDLTGIIKHISVTRLYNGIHYLETFHAPNNESSTQQLFLSRKCHLIAKKLQTQTIIYPEELKQLLEASGYKGRALHAVIYSLHFADQLHGFMYLEYDTEKIQDQHHDFDKFYIMSNIFGAYFSKKHSFEKNLLQKKIYTSILNGMNNLIYITDINTNKILFMNKTMKKAFALEHPEGKICWQVLQKNISQRCNFCPIATLLRDPAPDKIIRWEEFNSKTGRIYENYDSLINWFDGSIVHLQHSIDITASHKLFHDACFDELTNTLTRRAGKELLEKLITDTKQNGNSFITCMLDINSLKIVNDNYGHGEGDKLITKVCQTINANLGNSDIFFRLSGDEFIIVFTNHSLQYVKEILQKALLDLKISSRKESLPYTPSFTYGLLEFKASSDYSLTDILTLVDEKMYEQKRAYHIHMRQQEAQQQKQITPTEKKEFSYPSQYLYDALIKSTDDYLYICDIKSDIFHYPQAMVEEFGLPGEYVKNAAAIWGAKVHPEDQGKFLASNQEILDGRTNYHCVEYRAQNKYGKWIWVRCRGNMQYNEMGEPCLFAGFIKNLGENYTPPIKKA